MAIEDFDLAPEMAVDPLDVAPFGGTPPLVPNSRPSPMGGGGVDMKKYAPLLAMIPIVAKRGGMGAVGALLRGFQASQMQAQQQARLSAQDARLASNQESQDAYRQAQLENQRKQIENQRLQGQSEFRSKFAAGLQGLDSDEAIRAYLQLQSPQASALGINPAELDTFALQAVPPSTLQKRSAEKQIAKLKTQFGEKWMEQGSKFTHQIGGESVSFDELMRRAGFAADPNAPKPAPASKIAPDIPLDRQHAMALAAGDTELAKLITQSMTDQDVAKRDPRQPVDPTLEEIRKLRLEQMRNQPAPSLPPATQRRVDSLAKGFDSQPAVKTAQKMAEAVTFANSLDVNTKNPADDQALIYNFAKAMDPESVVREGEYATVQKYAQSWAESFGFNIARMFSNTPFLTPQARQNMKATIQAKFKAGRGQYENLRKSYAARINKITQGTDGDTYLTDYGGAFPDDATGSDEGWVDAGNGVRVREKKR